MIRSILLVSGVILAYLIGCKAGAEVKPTQCQISYITLTGYIQSKTHIDSEEYRYLYKVIDRYNSRCGGK